MANPYFPDDSYHTAPDTPRAWPDRICPNGRIYFYFRFLNIIRRCRSYAVRGIYDRERWASTSMDVFRLIESCGGRFHITGLNNLAGEEESLVIISNHMSTLETVIFPVVIAPFRPVTFVVKEELVKARIFGPIMRSRNPVVVGRRDPRRDLLTVLEEGEKRLRSGVSLVVFPQSTRQSSFNPERFNSLGIKLARRAGCRVVPTAIKTDFWGNGKRIKDLGPIRRRRPIHMKFDPPLEVTGNGAEQHRYIVNFIQKNLADWS